jgi:Glycosyltransferase family 92
MTAGDTRERKIAVGSFVVAFVVFHVLLTARDILVSKRRLIVSTSAVKRGTNTTRRATATRDPFLGVWKPVTLHVQNVADNVSSPWPVVSAVPVLHPDGSGEVALIGPWSEGASDMNLSAHECVFADGSTRAVRMFENLSLYRSITAWVCDLPKDTTTYLFRKRFNASESSQNQRCLTFEVRLVAPGSQSHLIRACNKPSTLPYPSKRYEAAICVIVPLMSVAGQPLNSGHVAAPEFIEYYVRHGVQQIVFYVMEGPNREHDLRVLQPFVDSGHVSIVDVGPDMFESDNDIYDVVLRGADGNYTMTKQPVMNNDCLYRMKYRAKWVGFVDVDEFLVGKPWYKRQVATPSNKPPSIVPLLHAVDATVDAVSIQHKRFRKSPDCASNGSYLGVFERETDWAPTWGKTFVRPERVMVQWVHSPSNCVGRECNVQDLPDTALYHLRFAPDEVPDNGVSMTMDGVFAEESVAVFQSACAKLQTVGIDCRRKVELLPRQ